MDRKRVFIRSEDAGCAAGQAARPAWRDSLLANSGASGETGAALAVGRLHQAGARGWLAGGLKGQQTGASFRKRMGKPKGISGR